MTPLANWNGEIMPLDEVRVPALDRAFLFGDAVYEAMRVYGGRVFLADRHYARLQRSLDLLRIRADVDRVAKRVEETLKASGAEEGLVYIQITRGAASKRTHAFPSPEVSPNELLYIASYAGDPHAHERATGVKTVTHPDIRWQRRDIKTVNLLGNCIAAQAAKEAGAYEAILIDSEGVVTEGAHTSVFGVKEGQLRTSPLGTHILPGVTRQFVLELAEEAGVSIGEEPMRVEDLENIDELFLTGTSTEVLAISHIDEKPVRDGTPGPVTQRLAALFRQRVHAWLHEGATL